MSIAAGNDKRCTTCTAASSRCFLSLERPGAHARKESMNDEGSAGDPDHVPYSARTSANGVPTIARP
jgi:hypothetical protein